MGALAGASWPGSGSRAAGSVGGRSMADAMERRGPARGNEDGCAAAVTCAPQARGPERWRGGA